MFSVGNIFQQIIRFGDIKVETNDEMITQWNSLGIPNTRVLDGKRFTNKLIIMLNYMASNDDIQWVAGMMGWTANTL